MLTSNFQYFTGQDQQMLETKLAIGQMYQQLLCLASSHFLNFYSTTTATTKHNPMRECVWYVCVCVTGLHNIIKCCYTAGPDLALVFL